MDILDKLAESRIQEAVERGELSDLPGEGQPLQLDDDRLVPEELRTAYRLLKNAGFLPPELQLRREVQDAEQLLFSVEDAADYARARAKLELLRSRLNSSRRDCDLRYEEAYFQRLLERIR